VSRIFYLSPWFPYPADNGAKTRIFNVLRHLAQDHEVTLAAFSPGEADCTGLRFCSKVIPIYRDPFRKSRVLERLRFFSVRPVVTYRIREAAQVIDQELQTGNYDVAVAFTSPMAAYLAGARMPRVLDIDNGLTSFAVERLDLERTWPGRLQAWVSLQKAARFERSMVGRFDATIALSGNPGPVLRGVLSEAAHAAVVGNGVDLAHYSFMSEEPEPNSLIYTGSLTFSANYDAVRWFLTEIFPLVKAAIPDVTFTITGSTDGVDLRSLPIGEGVTLSGYVRDVRPLLTRSSICIVPIRLGGGQRMKIFEAMAVGVPVVSTSKGIESIDATNNEHALIADTPAAFASAVINLLRDANQRRTIASNARRLMERRYDWEQLLTQFQSVVTRMANTTPNHHRRIPE